MEAIIKCHPKFKVLFDPPKGTRIIILIGGRAGMKTYQASLASVVQVTLYNKRIQVLREEATRIKQSILNEIFTRYDKANVDGAFNGSFVKTENTIKNAKTGEEVVFTQGFRASSNSKTANMKGVSNVDIGIVEEMADIVDEDKFNVWKSGIRGEGAFIVMILNTPDVNHWVVKRYFNVVPVTNVDYPNLSANDIEGYFKLVPKILEGVHVVQTSFRDNPYLPQIIRDEYEAYGVKGGDYENIHYFLTEIEGLASTGKKGAIYKGWDRISFAEYKSLDYYKSYYLDWGATDPCAIGEVKSYQNIRMVHPLNSTPIKSQLEVGIALAKLGFTTKEVLICDNSQPEWIKQLRRGWDESNCDVAILEKYPALRNGFTAVGVKKPPGSKKGGIEKLQSCQVFIVDTVEGDNAWSEYIDYCWELDKNGNPTDQPMDGKDHHMDGIRYTELARNYLVNTQ